MIFSCVLLSRIDKRHIKSRHIYKFIFNDEWKIKTSHKII